MNCCVAIEVGRDSLAGRCDQRNHFCRTRTVRACRQSAALKIGKGRSRTDQQELRVDHRLAGQGMRGRVMRQRRCAVYSAPWRTTDESAEDQGLLLVGDMVQAPLVELVEVPLRDIVTCISKSSDRQGGAHRVRRTLSSSAFSRSGRMPSRQVSHSSASKPGATRQSKIVRRK
jgi:hypothetical protein